MNITFEMLKNNISVLVVFWYSCDNVTSDFGKFEYRIWNHPTVISYICNYK